MTTIDKYPLERAKIVKKFVGREIGLTILFTVIGILTALFAGGLLLAAAAFVFLLFIGISAFSFWYETQYYKKYFYDFLPDVLVIKKGVFMPTETTLPWDKIQDVYIDQDILDRIFGIWDLHVSTATLMSGYHAHIDGVNKSNAETMREQMLAIIKKKK